MHTSEEIHDTQVAQQVVQPSVATTVTSSVVDVTPTPPEPKRRAKKVEPEAIAVAEPVPMPEPEPAPAPEPEPTPAPVETPAAPEPTPAPLPSVDPAEQTAESTLALIGITYAQLAKLAADLEWWPEADTYPTVADLPLEIQIWVVRNKRGIARAFQKAGGAL
jgi:outer membrane biosynthesis protein TonB